MIGPLEELEQRNPEWRPWLAIVRDVLAEIDDTAWDAVVPEALQAREPGAPLLAGIAPPDGSVESLRRKLAGRHVPQAAIEAVLPLPFLHACRRRWASAVPPDWARGYCPLCGAWPALAEICGVERDRYLRCGRCGSAWQRHGLACPYCDTIDHDQLACLVVERAGPPSAIEACRRCLGYVKALTRLRLGAPAQGLIDDLASVELDIAAAGRGYRRPERPGYP